MSSTQKIMHLLQQAQCSTGYLADSLSLPFDVVQTVCERMEKDRILASRKVIVGITVWAIAPAKKPTAPTA